jgi:hypothetical protein
MNHWTAKVKVTEEDLDTGKVRARTYTYLVQAESIEAAQTLVKKFFEGTTMDHEVRSIGKSGITEYVTVDSISN